MTCGSRRSPGKSERTRETALTQAAGRALTVSGTPLFAVSYVRDESSRIVRKQETVAGVSDTYDYTYTEWIYGPTALTPEQEPPLYPTFPLSSVEVEEPAEV